MRVLFVHQNFPGQFPHLAVALAQDARNEVVALGDEANLRHRPNLHPRIRRLGYLCKNTPNQNTHHYLRGFESHVRRGQMVARAAIGLRQNGFVPDVVVAHPGWGEALFLRDVFPKARHIYYCEFFYRSEGSDVGFDPEFPSELDDQLRVRIKNSTQLISLEAADILVSPTEWQKSTYPSFLHEKIRVLHDGIDTRQVAPAEEASIDFAGKRFSSADEIVTFVARNLEPYRGFHTFMRALPAILARRTNAQALIVGGDEVSYGRTPPGGKRNYRETYLQEIQDRIDISRIHFLGRIPYPAFLNLLRISSIHIYLTYPFVLSWSMLEAMASGCLVLGSATPPVAEVIKHGENGLLTDFFDPAALADQAVSVLENPQAFRSIREQARQTICAHYDLATHCLPAWLDLVNGSNSHDSPRRADLVSI